MELLIQLICVIGAGGFGAFILWSLQVRNNWKKGRNLDKEFEKLCEPSREVTPSPVVGTINQTAGRDAKVIVTTHRPFTS